MSKQPSQTASIITVVGLGLLAGGGGLGMCICCGLAGFLMAVDESDTRRETITKGEAAPRIRTDVADPSFPRVTPPTMRPMESPFPDRSIDSSFPPRTPIPPPRIPAPSFRPPRAPSITPGDFGRPRIPPRPTPPRFPSGPLGPGFDR